MSDEKPWLEKLDFNEHTGDVWIACGIAGDPDAPDTRFAQATPELARLIAAAPQLARALALAEMADGYFVCPVCDGSFSDPNPSRVTKHFDCPLDAALTAAGLDTAEKREEARRWGA